MIIIDEKKYYTKSEVGQIIGRSGQTVGLWDKWSEEREQKGEERLIPKPIQWKSNYRMWSEIDVRAIQEFADSIKRGQLRKYTHRTYKNTVRGGQDPEVARQRRSPRAKRRDF